MSLRRLAREAEKEHAIKSVGGDEPAIRHKLREEVQASIPGWALRQDAPKMQLKPDEQEALELVSTPHPTLRRQRKELWLRLLPQNASQAGKLVLRAAWFSGCSCVESPQICHKSPPHTGIKPWQSALSISIALHSQSHLECGFAPSPSHLQEGSCD